MPVPSTLPCAPPPPPSPQHPSPSIPTTTTRTPHRYGQAPTEGIASALQSYSSAVEATPHVPHPQPLYQEAATTPGTPGSSSSSSALTDLQYELLRLYSGDARPQEGGALAALLRSAGSSPNPLDCVLPWHVMGVLEALEVLPLTSYAGGRRSRCSCVSPLLVISMRFCHLHIWPPIVPRDLCYHQLGTLPPSNHPTSPTPSAGEVQPEVFKLHASLLALLDLLPNMSHEALYVAMCTPDAPDSAPGALRRATVLELLQRYCPQWAEDEARQQELTGRLGVPAAWLHQAVAQVRGRGSMPGCALL